jgi:deoxyribodipyrimidine photo-lyase
VRTTTLLWLRRDLRLHDHPALHAAARGGAIVVPVFCFDDRLLRGHHASGARTQFLLDCLTDLRGALGERGSGLVIRRGRPERELPALARELGAERAHFTADVSGFASARDARVVDALRAAGTEAHAHPGSFVVDDLEAIRTTSNRPYTVFTPFHRAWLRQPRRALLPKPASLAELPSGLDRGGIPTLQDLGLHQVVAEPAHGGEQAARGVVTRYLREHVAGYEDGRDALDSPTASRLSPYLHFGCISARELESRVGRGEGARAYSRQLCWRDFYAHVLLHFPDNAGREYQERYRGTIDWNGDAASLRAWQQGQTGFPLVDAGMRQLRREGWMDNRARLVVGSFLTKDLGIDWREGERWFMRMLLDGDEASNNGNWQWIASVGVDPQPPFRRMFNPVRQQERFDPEGSYVRRYVAELRKVPDRYLSQPWTMPADIQRSVGCRIGADYPGPIVDHPTARREALQRYSALASTR